MSARRPSHLAQGIVVVGGSAGALGPIARLLQAFTPGSRTAVLVVVHIPESSPSVLHLVFGRASAVSVSAAVDRAPLEGGCVAVAVPGHHLLVERDRMRVVVQPRVAGLRPALDPLFESAARHWRARAAGVVVSGSLYDGSAGLLAMANGGGGTFVQDPSEAAFPDMPRHAIAAVPAAVVGPIDELAAALSSWDAVAIRPPAPA